MTKRLPIRTNTGFGGRILAWTKNHKLISSLIVVALFTAGAIGYITYTSYMAKLSKSDFDRIATMAETVLEKTSGHKVYTNRTCSYNHGEFITIPTLSCRINMVTYLPYETSENAITIAHRYEQNIHASFGNPLLGLSNVYQYPQDASDTVVVGVENGAHLNCDFTIDDNTHARDAVAILPEQTDNNLIALSFDCVAPSQAAYFPVTD